MRTFTPEEWAEAVDHGIREGVRIALERHRLAGRSIVVWRDGRVVEIPAEKIAGHAASAAIAPPVDGNSKP